MPLQPYSYVSENLYSVRFNHVGLVFRGGARLNSTQLSRSGVKDRSNCLACKTKVVTQALRSQVPLHMKRMSEL